MSWERGCNEKESLVLKHEKSVPQALQGDYTLPYRASKSS